MDYSQLDKLDAEIADLKRRIAERDAKKVPQPKTNVGWASYIMNDDPHLLDMYQNAERQWNQMQEQNKLTRDISAANRAEQERYAMDDLMRQRTQAQAKYDTAKMLYESAVKNEADPDTIAKLKLEAEVSGADLDFLNKRTGFKPKPIENPPQVKEASGQDGEPAAATPTADVKKAKWKNIKSFKTEEEKNAVMAEVKSHPTFSTDPELTDLLDNLGKIQSDEAKKAAEEARKAEDAAANVNFQKTGRFDKSKYKIEYTINGAKLVRKNK